MSDLERLGIRTLGWKLLLEDPLGRIPQASGAAKPRSRLLPRFERLLGNFLRIGGHHVTHMLNEMVTALRLTRSPKGKGGGRLTAGGPPCGPRTPLGWGPPGVFPQLSPCSLLVALPKMGFFSLGWGVFAAQP